MEKQESQFFLVITVLRKWVKGTPPYIPFNLTTRILIHPHKVVPKTGGVKDLDC